MGFESGREDESPVHEVEVRAFRLARTPVTNEEYGPFLAAGRAAEPPWWRDPAFHSPRQPVVGVTWDEAARFAAWLSERLSSRWRLPTEAEWEFAACGGRLSPSTAWGDELPAGEVPEGPLTAPWETGRGTPNGYGLLDMGTIVHEWCLDWYAADYYGSSPGEDPSGPSSGRRRSSRGGSWRHAIRWSSPSARSSLPPDCRYSDYGFRVLREIDPA
jgi:formylglycine-generating enzyme required for sulfatase activity